MRGMNGFTLIELLVTLAILVIAVTVAIPSYSALVQRQQMTTAVNDMVHLLTFARQESMRRQKLVTVCPSADQSNCTSDWNLPLILFADYDRNEVRDSSEPLLRVFTPHASGLWTFNRDYLQYQPSGMINGSNGSLLYCPESRSARYARMLFVSLGGRVRLSQDTNNDGIHENSSRAPLNCDGADL